MKRDVGVMSNYVCPKRGVITIVDEDEGGGGGSLVASSSPRLFPHPIRLTPPASPPATATPQISRSPAAYQPAFRETSRNLITWRETRLKGKEKGGKERRLKG